MYQRKKVRLKKVYPLKKLPSKNFFSLKKDQISPIKISHLKNIYPLKECKIKKKKKEKLDQKDQIKTDLPIKDQFKKETRLEKS